MNDLQNKTYTVVILVLTFVLYLFFLQGCEKNSSPTTSICQDSDTLIIYGAKGSPVISPYKDIRYIRFNDNDYRILKNYILYTDGTPWKTNNESYNIILGKYNFLKIRGFKSRKDKDPSYFTIAFDKDKTGILISPENKSHLIEKYNSIISQCNYCVNFDNDGDIRNYVLFFERLDVQSGIIRIDKSNIFYEKDKNLLIISMGGVDQVEITEISQQEYSSISQKIFIDRKQLNSDNTIMDYKYSGIDYSKNNSFGIVNIEIKVKKNGEILYYDVQDIYRVNLEKSKRSTIH